VAKAEPVVEIEETPAEPVKTRSKILILLAFSVVVLLQMIFLAYVLRGFSSPPPGEQQESIPRLALEEPVQRLDLVEFPITEPFTCMAASEDAISGFNVMAKFTLKIEKSKLSGFETLHNKVKDKIRGEIVTILRSSKIEDLNDPNCTRIRNRILLKINEILAEPQPLVKEVIVVDFRSTPM